MPSPPNNNFIYPWLTKEDIEKLLQPRVDGLLTDKMPLVKHITFPKLDLDDREIEPDTVTIDYREIFTTMVACPVATLPRVDHDAIDDAVYGKAKRAESGDVIRKTNDKIARDIPRRTAIADQTDYIRERLKQIEAQKTAWLNTSDVEATGVSGEWQPPWPKALHYELPPGKQRDRMVESGRHYFNLHAGGPGPRRLDTDIVEKKEYYWWHWGWWRAKRESEAQE